MTLEEYEKRRYELDLKAEKSYNDLIIECALSNAIFHNGDIIQNHVHIILIQRVKAYKGLERMPVPCYEGIVLRKDLQPLKKKTIGAIFDNKGVKLIKSATLIKRKRTNHFKSKIIET